MFRSIWTGKIAAGKNTQAIEWMQKVKDFYKKYDGVPQIESFLGMFGEGGVMIFMSDYEDLASYQKLNDQVLSDPEYFKFAEESADIIIEGSVNTYLMRST